MERTLRVGYLHVGRERSGLRRYGAILAQEARRRAGLEVLEGDAGGREASWAALRRAAQALRSADVVHVQWKLADWDPRLGGIPRTELLLASLRRPIVVTLHDVFERTGLWERRLSPAAIGLRRLGHAASHLVVHAEEERRRLHGLVPADRIGVVPHFVEDRPDLPAATTARNELRLEGRRVVTLLGYMTRRRGHRLVIEAMAELPEDVVALFVGSPIEGRDHIAAGLASHAAELGLADRVRFLGYVPDEQLDLVLAATDVALCPFSAMSASGALATWISAGRPIVTSDLAPFRELDAMSPGALRIFAPYDATALASRILETLDEAALGRGASTETAEPGGASSGQDPHDGRDARVLALAERLATPRILERYLELYRSAAAQSRS